MRTLAIAAALTAATLAPAAWAQNAPAAPGNGSMPPQGQMGGRHMSQSAIAQRLRSDLAKAGFTDIHVMPESFLVRAKNSQGMPVMMVINPDSITAVTAMTPRSGGGGTSSAGGGNAGGAGSSGTVGSGGGGTTSQ